MEPNNPDNQQPLIYRIADAAGVFHLVAPVNHTHTYQDVPGLAGELNELWSGLNEKANAEDVTEALAGKANAIGAGSPTGGIVIANTAGEIERSNKTITDLENAIAAKQDALIFDTTPTANSTNPVTSGGVKAAIDDATKAVFGSMPYYITAAHEKMYVHTRILRNNTGSTIKLSECVDVSALPAAERANVYWNVQDIDIPNNTEIGIRFVRASNAVFLFYDGNFDY